MTDTHHLLDQATSACLQLVAIAWPVAAAYFAWRTPGGWRHRLGHFLRTLLPEPWLLLAVPVVVLVIRLVPQSTWGHLTYWHPLLAAPGFLVVLASTVLMLWARWVLGRMWAGRPLVQQGHELCTSGPYRVVRHPIYTGIVGLALGGMLVVGFGAMVVVLPATVAFAAWRVRVEDRMMLSTFGDRYRTYQRQVPALVPGAPVTGVH